MQHSWHLSQISLLPMPLLYSTNTTAKEVKNNVNVYHSQPQDSVDQYYDTTIFHVIQFFVPLFHFLEMQLSH